MEFEPVKRQGLAVYFYTMRYIKNMRHYGYIHYVSDKMRYAVIYVDADKAEEIAEEISSLKYVKKVELSQRDNIDMTFEDAIENRIDPDLRDEEDTEENDFFESLAKQLANKETTGDSN